MAKQRLCILCVALLVLLCSCTSGDSLNRNTDHSASELLSETIPPDEFLASKPVGAPPTYATTLADVSLAALIQPDRILEMKAASQDVVLYVQQEKCFDESGMFAYYVTREMGVFNTSTQTIESAWIPEYDGWYFVGALTNENGAVFGMIADYENAYPSEYCVISVTSSKQVKLEHLYGIVHDVRSLENGNVIFSYRNDQNQFGVRRICDGEISDIFRWENEQGIAEPLGGEIAVCSNRFAYALALEGECAILIADQDGECWRVTLEYQKEKIDNFCLTPLGLTACLSVKEGTTQAHRELTLFSESGERLFIQRDDPLYRMAFADVFGVGVDSGFRLHLLYATSNRIGAQMLSQDLPELQEIDGNAVGILRADRESVYLYFSHRQELYRLTIAPAA